MTLEQFINELGITISNQPADRNPHMEGSESMDNYQVKLKRPKERGWPQDGAVVMRLYYSKGIGHKGAEPTVDEVLDCLALDASGIENASGSFESWCDEYGYDTDSRRAEKTFKVCGREAKKLNQFLGSENYSKLLWEIERR